MLKQYLEKLNINNIDIILEKFNIYTNLLLEWNEKFNLTGITKKDEIEVKHYIDSLTSINYIKGKVLDIGAGAGFPSIPLAIIRNDIRFTLVDSLNKRVTFLKEVIDKLQLTNVKAVHKRAEDISKNILYDTVTARAVAPLRILLEYTLPFVKIGGKVIAYKSEKAPLEIAESENSLKELGGK